MRNKTKRMKGGFWNYLFGTNQNQGYNTNPNKSSSWSWFGNSPNTGYGNTGYGMNGNTGYGMNGNTGYGMNGNTGYGNTGYGNTGYGNGYGYGGKKSKSKKNMKGGYKDNTPTTGLAAHAAPFSGPTAKPHNWVGGKTRRRSRKGSKTRKH
jgi:hypothetical protein